LRRKNKALLKKSAKQEQASQSNDGSIIVQSEEMAMTGLLLNPTKADLSPDGLLPHEGIIRPRAWIDASPVASPLVLRARLKRLLNGWMAAAIAYRERQAAWLASHHAGGRDPHNKRIYRGPIDDALERAARLRKRRRRKQP
jgi:hypothetical protein